MNEIIAKAVEELKEKEPNISYVRGMLETLLAMNTVPMTPVMTPPKPLVTVSIPQMIDGIPTPNIDKIKDVAAKSVEIE